MAVLKAHVENGRIVLDEPMNLPDGCEVEVRLVNVLDEYPPEERAALERELELAMAEADAGEGIDADEVLGELRRS